MSTKLRALSLGLLAILAVTGFAVVNASATVKGHFTSDVEHTIILGTENGAPHDLEFKEHNNENAVPITCTHAKYDGTIQSVTKTTQSVTVTPTYKECLTKGAASHNVTVHTNGCGFILSSHGNNAHGTVTVECPKDKSIVITHPNCTITVPEQDHTDTLEMGINYKTDTAPDGKHRLTADVTVTTITGHFHGGICIFLGTNHKFDMTGSLTVEGFDTNGNRVNITHTESP